MSSESSEKINTSSEDSKFKCWCRSAPKRYFVDSMSYMALGLFSSLIIGLILSQIAKIPSMDFIVPITDVVKASSPVIGCAIGGAIAYGLKSKPLVIFSAIVAGAVGYNAGGPVGAYISGIIAAEFGNLVAGKTKVDIIVTPAVSILSGGIIGILVGSPIQGFMQFLGGIINSATEMSPLPMGIVVAVVVGLVLTAPISSAALCIMLELSGLAAGAAAVGCCAQMIGFAVASYRDNGIGGFLSQGFGTSMLQFPNIVKHPAIWIAPTVTSAILGPISTCIFKMECNALGAGMGTSGLVGSIDTFAVMSEKVGITAAILQILLMHFIAPAVVTLLITLYFRKIGLVKDGDMRIGLQ